MAEDLIASSATGTVGVRRTAKDAASGADRTVLLPAVMGVDAAGNATATLPTGTNRSGTITTGGTAQQLAPANAARRFLKGQNLSSGDLWINEVGGTASAAQPSYRIPAGGTFAGGTNQAVSIWGATTGQAFSATEG